MAMYIATYLINVAALFYLMGLLYASASLNSDRKKPFLVAVILTVTIIVAEAGTLFIENGYLSLRSLLILCNILGFSLAPMIPLVITLIFDRRILSKLKWLLVPTILNVLVTVLSPMFGFIFYVDTNNLYMRGDYFFVFIAVYSINFLILVVSTLLTGNAYNYPFMRKLVALFIFTIIGTSIQLVYPEIYSSWHSVTLSLFLYFILMSEFDSSFDTLTGLYNRATFDKLAKQIAGPKAFSVIVLDINDFKNVNDTYGHDYGDRVIKIVASIVRKSFGKHYTCYRFGGDEFSIISNETEREKIERHLKAMTSALSEMREEDNPLPTVSYGYSIYKGGKDLSFDQVLKEADDQMYRYKKANKAV